ncbi:MAG: discoidin domain-containing protein [Chitinophagaceae bacterium]
MKYQLIIVCLLLAPSARSLAQEINLALKKPVTANSENSNYPAKNVVDGKISRTAKWMSGNRPPHILEINLLKYCNISRIVVHTGIPDAEKTAGESSQAAGFWSAKNFKLQYWDDANWTDIPNTEVHENRLTDIPFQFSLPINTFQIRFVCDDGEPISITEIEVFGEETNRPVANTGSTLTQKKESFTDQSIHIIVSDEQAGRTMKYVGYNQGYYMPGSNASGWLEYSRANSLRVWTSLNSYVPLTAVQVDKSVDGVEEFDRRKNQLRSSPENNVFLKWDTLLPLYSSTEKASNTNPMVLDYVLQELKRLGVDALLQINSTDFTGTWSNKWQQWQRYYALTYHAAKTGDVTMFAMQNEPNHKASGPMKLDQWISGMQIVSDAIKSAIEDVNKAFGKHLKPRMIGPVTAGNNPEWWIAVAKNLRTDYHGNKIDDDLLGIFSTHSYNSPAAGYVNRVAGIKQLLAENEPGGKSLPVVFTEIGRWMNSYLIDKEETMDSPSLFTEWAGIYTNNTRNGAYGMWAFKFSNTASDTYTRGVKSGHHFTWQGKRIVEDAYINLAKNKLTKTSGNTAGWPSKNVTDENKSDDSAWRSLVTDAPKWIEIDLGGMQTLGSAVIYTGSAGGEYTAPDRVKNFSLQYFTNDQWKDIPGCTEKGNKYAQVFDIFTEAVTTAKLRFISSDPGMIKVREIKVFAKGDGPGPEQNNYDISGIQRTGEVVRLFAKGFKDERPLFQTEISVTDENFDVLSSYDSVTTNYYFWLVQRGQNNDKITLDLSGLKIPAGAVASIETVGPAFYGEVTSLINVSAKGRLEFILHPQSVALLTISGNSSGRKMIAPVSQAYVSAGKNAGQRLGNNKKLLVSLDASKPENNHVTFIRWDVEKENLQNARKIIFHVKGRFEKGTTPFRLHVYAILGANWTNDLTWNTAPQLDSKEALIKDVGQKAFVAGEIAFTGMETDHMLDVTDLLKKHADKNTTFVLVRETRQLGDDEDKGRRVIISASHLEIFENR